MDSGTHDPKFPVLGRRAFLTMAATVGAGAFLAANSPAIAAAVADSGKKIIWLQGAGCGGCTTSFLNGGYPDILAAIDSISIDLAYHNGLMSQQGITIDGVPSNTSAYNAVKKRDEMIDSGGYVLVVEGAIPNGPDGTGMYCTTGNQPLKEIFSEAAEKADMIIALGTCAAFGGISAADGSVTDARGVAYFGASRFKGIMSELNMRKKVINVAGCPSHPDWFILTLADVLSGNEVDVDDYRRPLAFFLKNTIHDTCPWRGYYDAGQRNGVLAGDACLYDMGCKGTVAFADCPVRMWNGGVNMCTRAGGPCVACVEAEFPDVFMPFFGRIEDRSVIAGVDVNLAAKLILGATVAGVGVHGIKRLAIGDNERHNYDDDRESRKRKQGGK